MVIFRAADKTASGRQQADATKRIHSSDGGFSLVEVLFACFLLALALVPIAKAMNGNRKAAEALKALSLRFVADGDADAKENATAAKAEKEAAAGNPAADGGDDRQ